MTKNVSRIILLFLIISAGGIYYQFYSTLINIITITLSLLLFFSTRNRNIYFNQYLIKVLLLFSILAVNYFLNYNSVNGLNYLTLGSNIFVVSILVYYYNSTKTNIIYDLSKILKFIIIHATLNFLISNFFFSSFTIWVKDSVEFDTMSLLNLFFVNSTESFSQIKRNCGLFWEPGILQIYINLYVFFKMFLFKDMKFTTLVFCFALVLTTFSTTGLILLSTLSTVFYWHKIKKLSSIIPIVIFMVFSLTILKQNIEDKFQGENKNSSQARIYDAVIGSILIFESPLYGIGYNSIKSNNIYSDNESYSLAINIANMTYIQERGNTNSIIMNFVYWGIPLGTLVILLLKKQTLVSEKKTLFFIIMLIFCSTEPLLFSGFFFLILLSGYLKIKPNIKLIK